MNKEFTDYISKLKEKHKLTVVDTHVHPLDVMGVVHQNDYKSEKDKYRFENKPGLMEVLKFGRIANFLSNNLFNLFTNTVVSEIEKMYEEVSQERILDEMDNSLVDKAVFLSVEPWTDTLHIKEKFKNERFLLLGSIDVHNIDLENIENLIDDYARRLNIVGLKLHPNLQNFKPQPSDNPPHIADKLKLIYRTAEKNNLYLLFHGGKSSFTEYVDDKYIKISRSKNNALLKNFCNEKGESEIFGKYKIPLVIAHLGHFGMNKIDKKIVSSIINNHKDVYFDTAAVSPSMIKEFIEIAGSERIIFGSDALYNKMIYNIYFIYLAIKKAKTKENKEMMLLNILGENYKKILS